MVFIEILQNQAEHSAGERNWWKKEKDTDKSRDSRANSQNLVKHMRLPKYHI